MTSFNTKLTVYSLYYFSLIFLEPVNCSPSVTTTLDLGSVDAQKFLVEPLPLYPKAFSVTPREGVRIGEVRDGPILLLKGDLPSSPGSGTNNSAPVPDGGEGPNSSPLTFRHECQFAVVVELPGSEVLYSFAMIRRRPSEGTEDGPADEEEDKYLLNFERKGDRLWDTGAVAASFRVYHALRSHSDLKGLLDGLARDDQLRPVLAALQQMLDRDMEREIGPEANLDISDPLSGIVFQNTTTSTIAPSTITGSSSTTGSSGPNDPGTTTNSSGSSSTEGVWTSANSSPITSRNSASCSSSDKEMRVYDSLPGRIVSLSDGNVVIQQAREGRGGDGHFTKVVVFSIDDEPLLAKVSTSKGETHYHFKTSGDWSDSRREYDRLYAENKLAELENGPKGGRINEPRLIDLNRIDLNDAYRVMSGNFLGKEVVRIIPSEEYSSSNGETDGRGTNGNGETDLKSTNGNRETDLKSTNGNRETDLKSTNGRGKTKILFDGRLVLETDGRVTEVVLVNLRDKGVLVELAVRKGGQRAKNRYLKRRPGGNDWVGMGQRQFLAQFFLATMEDSAVELLRGLDLQGFPVVDTIAPSTITASNRATTTSSSSGPDDPKNSTSITTISGTTTSPTTTRSSASSSSKKGANLKGDSGKLPTTTTVTTSSTAGKDGNSIPVLVTRVVPNGKDGRPVKLGRVLQEQIHLMPLPTPNQSGTNKGTDGSEGTGKGGEGVKLVEVMGVHVVICLPDSFFTTSVVLGLLVAVAGSLC